MKSISKILLLLAMGTLMSACNEKISPELQTGNSTVIPPVVTPDTYYFKVTNQSPAILNYVLHRTGPGNAATECKVSTVGYPLTSDLYIGDGATAFDLKKYDIACFMEAEELSLYYNGLDFQIEASKNTCEYVAYTPYSYFDAIPGTTSAAWSGYTCDEGVGSPDIATYYGAGTLKGVDVIGGTVRNLGCDEMVDASITTNSLRLIKPIPDNAQELCIFDYTLSGAGQDGNGQNCDSGRMTFSLTNMYDSDSDPVTTVIAAKPESRPAHSCGGKTISCQEGAFKRQTETAGSASTNILSATLLNTDFSLKYSLPKTMGARSRTSFDIVNYRRGLASPNLNFVDYTTGNEILWGDTNYNKSYDPTLMEKYSVNKALDGNPIIDTAGGATAYSVSNTAYKSKQIEHGYRAAPIAADPFLGTSARVNPFYTFYCLDRAMEIKARIRMVVRDWDKVFPTTTGDFELVSDVYKSLATRRQDLPDNEEEIPGDPGTYNLYNDIADWDNITPMDRTDPNLIGIYDPGFTYWSPSSGWWNPAIFPKQGPFTAAP